MDPQPITKIEITVPEVSNSEIERKAKKSMAKEGYPKTLEEFIDRYKNLLEVWCIKFGFGGELEDVVQDVLMDFLNKQVVEKFDPTLVTGGDFLSYIKLKVNRLLCNRYNKRKRERNLFESLDKTDSDGESVEINVEDKTLPQCDLVMKWWDDHRSVLSDPKIREPLAIKMFSDKAVIVTPVLIINMILMGYEVEKIIETLCISRSCFNTVKVFIQEKFAPIIVWADGGD